MTPPRTGSPWSGGGPSTGPAVSKARSWCRARPHPAASAPASSSAAEKRLLRVIFAMLVEFLRKLVCLEWYLNEEDTFVLCLGLGLFSVGIPSDSSSVLARNFDSSLKCLRQPREHALHTR